MKFRHGDFEIGLEFHTNWADELRSRLGALGVVCESHDDVESIAIKYFNLMKRRIEARPRRIFESREFSCPSDHLAAYEIIKSKVQAGDDLTPHQSRLLTDPNFNDLLLNDWDVQHFHLGTTSDPDGFIARTGPLLFARVTPDAFYAIGIFNHKSFSKQLVVNTIQTNWPSSIEGFKLDGASIPYSLTDEQVSGLRKAGYNVLSKAPSGDVYAPLGGGSTASKTSTMVMMRLMKARKYLKQLEECVRDHFDEVIGAEEKDFPSEKTLQFVLDFQGDGIYAIENKAGIRVKLSDDQGPRLLF